MSKKTFFGTPKKKLAVVYLITMLSWFILLLALVSIVFGYIFLEGIFQGHEAITFVPDSVMSVVALLCAMIFVTVHRVISPKSPWWLPFTGMIVGSLLVILMLYLLP